MDSKLTIDKAFCASLRKVYLLPVFRDQLAYFHYALRLAIGWRLGRETRPARRNIMSHRNKKILNDLQDIFDSQPDLKQRVKDVLKDRLGSDLPLHFGFLEKVKEAAICRNRSSREGIISSDLDVLVEGWNAYADEPNNRAELKSVAEYAKVYNDLVAATTITTEDVLLSKKEWIIQRRTTGEDNESEPDGEFRPGSVDLDLPAEVMARKRDLPFIDDQAAPKRPCGRPKKGHNTNTADNFDDAEYGGKNPHFLSYASLTSRSSSKESAWTAKTAPGFERTHPHIV